MRQYVEDLEQVLKDDSKEYEAHFREAWKFMQGTEVKDIPDD